ELAVFSEERREDPRVPAAARGELDHVHRGLEAEELEGLSRVTVRVARPIFERPRGPGEGGVERRDRISLARGLRAPWGDRGRSGGATSGKEGCEDPEE